MKETLLEEAGAQIKVTRPHWFGRGKCPNLNYTGAFDIGGPQGGFGLLKNSKIPLSKTKKNQTERKKALEIGKTMNGEPGLRNIDR